MTVKITISDAFDGGNVKFIGTRIDPADKQCIDVLLQVKPDAYTELEEINHMQYFCFRALIAGIAVGDTQRVKYILTNAQSTSYPEAWAGTTVCYSTDLNDPDSWRRNLDTFYTQGQLSWEQEHDANGPMFFSYFPPYSYNRHLTLISQCAAAAAAAAGPRCKVMSLGQTLDGRDMDCIQVGTGDTICWIIHRQHPGETMAEYYAEGLLTRLLGLNGTPIDDQVTRICQLYTLYIVPCMCPDGAVRGYLRTNRAGANLNREWHTKNEYEAPTAHRSPEVLAVLSKMDETGVDCFLDVHGDEELPYNFISGAELVPNWCKRLESLHGAFVAAYSRHNSDMQQYIGYPPPDSAEEVLNYMNVATNQVCNRFDCLAMTLEMPFKDCLSHSDLQRGWTPARSRALGASVLAPLEYIHPYLRATGEFWTALPPEDAYVVTTDDYETALLQEEEPTLDFKMLKKRLYSDVHEWHKKHPASPQATKAK